MMFYLTDKKILVNELLSKLDSHEAGAVVTFEGRVRNHNEGHPVLSLEYQIYRELAQKEGEKILDEARSQFEVLEMVAIHREGHLQLGDIAVWIGVNARHRGEAYRASRYVIDEIKHRLPIWKKEHYQNRPADWVFCRHHHQHEPDEKKIYSQQSSLLNQDTLKKSQVLVVGAGGLGCPILLSLVQAGVGKIRFIDPDRVKLENLHRQGLYGLQDVGDLKVKVATRRLSQINPFIQLEPVAEWFNPEHLKEMDFVIDATDSMQAKYFIHDACLLARLPFISGAVYRQEFEVRTIIPGEGCRRCMVETVPDDSLIGNCNDFGVIGAQVSLAGHLMASETLQFLQSGTCQSMKSSLHMDLAKVELKPFKPFKKPDCIYCAGAFTMNALDLEVSDSATHELWDIRELSDEAILNRDFSHHSVVLACHRGQRSLKLVKELRQRGVEKVYSLRGGLGTCSSRT